MDISMKRNRGNIDIFKAAMAVFGVVFLGIAGWFLIGRNIFKVGTADHIVYALGLLVAAVVWCLFSVFGFSKLVYHLKKRTEPECRLSNLRTLMFMAICLLGMYYFNSGSNHGHRVATRYILLCFAVLLATYHTKEELWNKWSLLCVVGCAAGFVVYALLGRVEYAKRYEFVLGYFVAVCFGVLIFGFLSDMKSRKFREVSRGYTILLLGFFVLLILFRNTRGWTFTVAVPFTLLYLGRRSGEEWRELFAEFCNGVLLSFGVILAFSLLFRPYHKFFSPRYPLAFYSVATCSLYLTVVFLAAFFHLAEGYRSGKRGTERFFSILIMGVVCCYTVMTVSRTAFLTIGAAGAFAFFCMAVSQYKGQLAGLVLQYVTVLVSGIVLFPMVFTVTRTVPALVGHPFIMGGELWEETITSEDPMDSEKYMDIERFRTITVDKLFKSFSSGGQAQTSLFSPQRAPYRAGDTAFIPMVLVGHGVTPETWYNESEGSASNGRVDIFLAYLERLNLTGHDTMGVDTEEMSYAHAHNTFIQTAYDHGILVGIYFLVLGVVSVIRGILYCIRRPEDMYAVLPVLMITAFGVASITEWTFHPSILLGFTLLFVQGPLLGRLPEKQKKNEA